MRLEAVELRRVGLPLVRPYRTSFGTEAHKDVLLLRALTDDGLQSRHTSLGARRLPFLISSSSSSTSVYWRTAFAIVGHPA